VGGSDHRGLEAGRPWRREASTRAFWSRMMHHAMEMNHRIYWKQGKGHSLKVNALTGEHRHSFWDWKHGFQWNRDKPSRVYPLSSPWWYFFQCINRISLVWNKFLCANTWSRHSRYLLGKLQDHFNLPYHVPTCNISLLLLTCCFLFTFHFHFCRLFWIT